MNNTAVKTEDVAKNILKTYAREKKLNIIYIGTGEDRCECGVTTSMVLENSIYELIATVKVCSRCGDDDAFIFDVLKTY